MSPQITQLTTNYVTADKQTHAHLMETAYNYQSSSKQTVKCNDNNSFKTYIRDRKQLQDKIQKPHCIIQARKAQELHLTRQTNLDS